MPSVLAFILFGMAWAAAYRFFASVRSEAAIGSVLAKLRASTLLCCNYEETRPPIETRSDVSIMLFSFSPRSVSTVAVFL